MGTSADLVREAANQIGVKVTVRYVGHWKRVMARLSAGEIDLVIALYKDQARERDLLFSAPVLHDPITLFTRPDTALDFLDWQSLKDHRGAIIHGEVFGEAVDQKIKALPRLRRADDMQMLLRMIALNRVDYIIHGEYPVRAALHKHQGAPALQKVAVLGVERSYLAMAPTSACAHLLPALTDQIIKITTSATLEKRIMEDFTRWTNIPATSQASP